MAELNVIESAHRANIDRLIDEFGENNRDEILGLYMNQRENEESNARITDFTPIFVYRAVREALKEGCDVIPSPV
ncbi:MAG: hypothetical protein JW778_03540 [Candidatus Altiarchaeota archaeon]|nr:hypothetical protein [Candidatus Altiarchaeota archaeon]